MWRTCGKYFVAISVSTQSDSNDRFFHYMAALQSSVYLCTPMYSVQILKMKLCSVPIQYWIKSWGKAGWRCLHSVCFDDSFYTEKLPDMHHFHLLGNAVSVNWNCFWSRVGVFNLQTNGDHMVIILMLMPKPKSCCLKKKKIETEPKEEKLCS